MRKLRSLEAGLGILALSLASCRTPLDSTDLESASSASAWTQGTFDITCQGSTLGENQKEVAVEAHFYIDPVSKSVRYGVDSKDPAAVKEYALIPDFDTLSKLKIGTIKSQRVQTEVQLTHKSKDINSLAELNFNISSIVQLDSNVDGSNFFRRELELVLVPAAEGRYSVTAKFSGGGAATKERLMMFPGNASCSVSLPFSSLKYSCKTQSAKVEEYVVNIGLKGDITLSQLKEPANSTQTLSLLQQNAGLGGKTQLTLAFNHFTKGGEVFWANGMTTNFKTTKNATAGFFVKRISPQLGFQNSGDSLTYFDSQNKITPLPQESLDLLERMKEPMRCGLSTAP